MAILGRDGDLGDQVAIGHPEITFFVFKGDAAFISQKDVRSRPGNGLKVRGLAETFIEGLRSFSPGQGQGADPARGNPFRDRPANQVGRGIHPHSLIREAMDFRYQGPGLLSKSAYFFTPETSRAQGINYFLLAGRQSKIPKGIQVVKRIRLEPNRT
jgi:hypothetical protein